MPRLLVNLLQSTGTKGGIETYARELYKALSSTPGWEFVGLASRELAAVGADWFPGDVIDSGISGENRLTWARGELFAVSRHATRVRADLVHGPAMFGPLRTSMPTVVSTHDVLYFSHPELMQTKIYTEPVKWMERRGVSNATRIITISDYSAREIERHLRVPKDRIDVIPLAGRRQATSNAGLRRDDLFLAIGMRSPYKDFETVVRAWSAIPEANRPHLVITGSHGDDPLIPLVASLGLEKWVSLRRWVSAEELAELFSTATALIDSTLATGFSLPTVEAMMIRLPVLLADTEIFREVGGDAAAYFQAGDPADLARMVQEVSADAAGRAQRSEFGLAHWGDHTWKDVAAATLLSFEAAIADPTRIGGSRR
jgi:glycosyltransferase involved in cell wall biosynthesis